MLAYLSGLAAAVNFGLWQSSFQAGLCMFNIFGSLWLVARHMGWLS